MSSPSDRRYTDSHEWFLADGDTVTVGITQFATNELTDVTYVDMRRPGTTVDEGDTIGEVESVKTTSDVYSAITGEIAEINQHVHDDPSLLNRDPFGEGWLVRIKADDLSPLENLMDQSAYDAKYPA